LLLFWIQRVKNSRDRYILIICDSAVQLHILCTQKAKTYEPLTGKLNQEGLNNIIVYILYMFFLLFKTLYYIGTL
jgi:hypothetical protein